MNTKNNQRFKNMDFKLKAALLSLMKEMDFNKITVKKICDTAQVNRSTFYAHYTDLYDMMKQMEDHLIEELHDQLSTEAMANATGFLEWPFAPLLKHIRKHEYFYKITLQHRKNFPLRKGFEPMWEKIIKPHCEKAGITSENEMMYYFVYFQAGMTMVLKRWVDNGCQESEEQMAKLIHNCIPSVWATHTDLK